MNLAEAVFALEYPDPFRLRQNIVFSCFQSIHTWSSEIVVTYWPKDMFREEVASSLSTKNPEDYNSASDFRILASGKLGGLPTGSDYLPTL